MSAEQTFYMADEFQWDGRTGEMCIYGLEQSNYPKKRVVVESPNSGNRLAFEFDELVAESDLGGRTDGYYDTRYHAFYNCITKILDDDQTPFRLVFRDWEVPF
jgi:hypothetical protein